MTCGPLRGMRDAQEITAANPTLAQYAGNMCRTPGPPDAGLTGRPGFSQMDDEEASVVVMQALLTWTDANGARITTRVRDGVIDTYNWGTSTWTETVSAANLASASVALDDEDPVALVPFADGVVVSDGVNDAWWWDGTAGDGGIVAIPVTFYGPPTVYYSKLAGIDAAARNTFVWSEEGDPATGYDQGGYNNAWDNPGGYSDPLTAIIGTNEALYICRERVTIAITGAMASDFATAGTRSNISESVGTLSPWAVKALAQGILIVDADAQPWLVRLGGQPVALWTDCRQTVRETPRSALGAIRAVFDDCTASVLIGYPESGQTNPTVWLCFAQDDLQFVGVWSWGAASECAGEVVDGDGVARWAHASVGDGLCYVHGDLETGPWNDELAGGTQYIAHDVTAPALGYDLDRELVIDQIEAAITGGGTTRVSVSYETPRGQSTPLPVDLSANSVGGTWDVDDWDTMDWAEAGASDQRIRVGTRGHGRWVRPRLSHEEDGERFGVTVMRVRAFATPGNPRSP